MSVEGWKAVREQVELIATEVVELDRTWSVIYGLHQKGLLTEDQVAQLRSHNTRKEQVRQLVHVLVAASCSSGGDGGGYSSSSDSNLSVFLEILEEQGMSKLVRHLDPSGAHSPHGLGEDISTFSNLRLTPYHHQQFQEWTGGAQGTTTPTDQPLPTLPKPGQDITNNNRHNSGFSDNNNEADDTTDIADTTAITASTSPAAIPDTPSSLSATPRGPLSILVVPSREIGGRHHHPSEVYKNESEPRGLVFLANYKNFNDQQHDTREGSEIDVKNLMLLFSQMGYKTSMHINMTKWDTIQELRKFRNLEEHKTVDSCIVVFMSHGRDDTSFFTSDNQHLTVHNVVERFSNRECPFLKGKPKIFIFQFCRGTGPDIGVDAAPRQVANPGLHVETDSSNIGEVLVERDPTFTDMYIVYSTVGGFVSFRHPERGSWLVEAICEVFMRDACNTELEHLMKKVSRRVRMNFSTEGNKQACEFVQRAFDRHFYFNPRNLDTISSLNLRPLGEALPQFPHRHRRRKPLVSSRPVTPEPVGYGGARSRNPSGGSTCSEKLSETLDVLDHTLPGSHAIHPRIRSLSASRRRMSVPEPATLNPGMARGRSFSELNSEGASPVPSEVGELGAVTGWASTERLSPSLWEHPQRWGSSGSMDRVCGGGSYERFTDTIMKEESPQELPQEGFPLVHSQSALETILASELGGLTGVGPEVRAGEMMRHSYKRQLSVPSNSETLEKVNDVRRYLQIHDSDPNLIQPLKRIESFINKKKNEGKRRKKGEDASSLEY